MKMNNLTNEQIQEIEQRIDNRIYYSDKQEIRKLIKENDYALYYFVDVAMENIRTVSKIKDIFHI